MRVADAERVHIQAGMSMHDLPELWLQLLLGAFQDLQAVTAFAAEDLVARVPAKARIADAQTGLNPVRLERVSQPFPALAAFS